MILREIQTLMALSSTGTIIEGLGDILTEDNMNIQKALRERMLIGVMKTKENPLTPVILMTNQMTSTLLMTYPLMMGLEEFSQKKSHGSMKRSLLMNLIPHVVPQISLKQRNNHSLKSINEELTPNLLSLTNARQSMKIKRKKKILPYKTLI